MRDQKTIKIQKSSNIEIKLTTNQQKLIRDLFHELGQMFNNLQKMGITTNHSIFLYSLFQKESVDSSRIEGTKTKYEEIFHVISEPINNVFDWELINLIDLYKNLKYKVDKNIFKLNIDSLCNLHIDLFKKQDNIYFDLKKIISKQKPGQIFKDNNNPNWIVMKDYDLELVRPSEKEIWLLDLFENINNKEKDSIIELIKFHPIFEAIHPFADGNGRIGRLLMTFLYKIITGKDHYFMLSDIWLDKKDEYIRQINYVQLTNDWNNWTFYLIGILLESIKKRKNQVIEIINLYNKYSYLNKDKIYNFLVKQIFQEPIVNKSLIVKKIIYDLNIPQTTAYRKCEIFFQKINGIFKDGYYRFNELLNIVSR